MAKYSNNALWTIEWSKIPFSRIGWKTDVMWRATDDFCNCNFEMISSNLWWLAQTEKTIMKGQEVQLHAFSD